MSSTSRTLKRLGVGTVAGCTLLAMPYVGVATAFAAAPGVAPVPSDVTITSQVTGNASPRNDGTDTTVKVTANVAYSPATGTASNAAAPGSVKFTYRPNGGTTDVLIGMDSTAPYSVPWTPPAGGGSGYTLFAEALDSSGNSYATPAKSTARTTAVADASSAHFLTPAEGGTVGYFASDALNNASTTNTISVSGTRSSDLPAIDLYTQVRDNATGVITGLSAVGTVGAGTPAAGASQAWSATAKVDGPIPANADVLVTAVAYGSSFSDELIEAKLVKQVLTNVTVAPPSATKPAGATQDYVVTALDQNGAGIAGLKVTSATDNAAVATLASSSKTTGAGGVATFTATSTTTAGTATFTFQTQLDGLAYDQTKDFSRTASLTTYVSKPTSATLTAGPSKALYASPGEYTGTFPAVTLCVIDQNGAGTPAGIGGTPVVTVTRTDSNTAAGTTPVAAPVTTTAKAGTNCYTVNYPTATGTFGTDAINAYFENNGTPGQQAGDVAAPVLTLHYANLSIKGLATQSQKGTATTVSFKVLGADGSPFGNRQVTLTATAQNAAGGFTATQPTGTTAPAAATPNKVIATTDANGIASATVNSPATPSITTDQTVTVVATDDITNANQVKTNQSSTPTDSVVTFRDKSVALATLAKVVPSADKLIVPSGSANTTGFPRPGDVQQVSYQLLDANAGALANTSIALTLDHGFFTADCPTTTPYTEQYANCAFSTAPAAAGVAGNLASQGASKTLTSDASGVVTFSVAIARDTALDANGQVVALVTGVANAGTAKSADPVTTFSTRDVAPINGGTVKLVPTGTTTSLSGDKQVQAYDKFGNLQDQPVAFAVHVADQFGNLVRLPAAADVKLAVAGGGILSGATAKGSYTAVEVPFTLTSKTNSLTGESNTVTATWAAPTTQFKAGTQGSAPNTKPDFTTVAGATSAKTDSFTVSFYAIDLKNLGYTFASTPGNSVPVNTAVTTSVTVKDQKANPVQNLGVQFIRSGPSDSAGNAQADNGFNMTNAAGKAGFSFSSGAPGTATVTVIVTDNSGNELSRGVQNVTFTSSTPAPTGTVTIQGPTSQFVKYGTRMVVTGQAPANSSVTVYFHRAYVAGLTPKTATANASGVWSVVYSAVDDFSYYAQVGSARAGTVLTRIDPSVSGADRTARKGQMVTVSGKSGARSAVNVHVGSAVHAVRADASGVWSYTFKFAGTVAVFANRTEHNVHTAGITIRG